MAGRVAGPVAARRKIYILTALPSSKWRCMQDAEALTQLRAVLLHATICVCPALCCRQGQTVHSSLLRLDGRQSKCASQQLWPPGGWS